jgi:hypothetical protein
MENIIDNLRSDGQTSPRNSFDSRLSTRSLTHQRKRKRPSSFEGSLTSVSASLSFGERVKTPTAELLPSLSGELRTYQLSGVRWLGSHFIQGQNAILSDEHQADRQIQAIGTLAFLQSRNIGGPFLIVSNPDLLSSWSSELHRLVPAGLLLHTYDGSSSSRDMLGLIAGHRMDGLMRVVLVSHALFYSDRQSLCRYAFKLVVIDSSFVSPSQCLEETFQQPLSTSQCSPLILLLTDAHPARSPSQPFQEIWPFIRLIVPEHFDRLYSAVAGPHSIHHGHGRDQNRVTTFCSKHSHPKPSTDHDMLCDEDVEDEQQQVTADLLGRLQSIVDQRVLSRSAAQFDLHLPRRETQTNLYDLFATLDQDQHNFDSHN